MHVTALEAACLMISLALLGAALLALLSNLRKSA